MAEHCIEHEESECMESASKMMLISITANNYTINDNFTNLCSMDNFLCYSIMVEAPDMPADTSPDPMDATPYSLDEWSTMMAKVGGIYPITEDARNDITKPFNDDSCDRSLQTGIIAMQLTPS